MFGVYYIDIWGVRSPPVKKPQPTRYGDMPNSRIHLTKRQREILEMIGDHWSNQQIAAELHISLHTVKNHVRELIEKLGGNRHAAYSRAVRMGLMG